MGEIGSDIEVERYLLKSSIERKDWDNVNSFCNKFSKSLTRREHALWIRSRFEINDFPGCIDLCDISGDASSGAPIYERCRYRLRAAMKIGNEIEILKSIDFFQSKFPDDREILVLLMRRSYSSGQFLESLRHSDKILESHPQDKTALKFRARSITKIGKDTEETRSAWGALLSVDVDNLEAMNNIARSQLDDSEVEMAKETLDKTLILDNEYHPAHNTMARLRLMSPDLFDEENNASSIDYRGLYSLGKYSEVIEKLGGLENCNNWKIDEALFIHRSLFRLNRHFESVSLFKLNTSHQRNPQILNQIIESAISISDTEVEENAMQKLLESSADDIQSSLYYLRHLIYNNTDDRLVSDNISISLQRHGGGNISRLVSFILKTMRYDLLKSLGLGENIGEILDPVHGTLKNKISEREFSRLWSDLNPKIRHAIGKSPTKKLFPRAFIVSCNDSDTLFPLLQSKNSKFDYSKEIDFKENTLDISLAIELSSIIDEISTDFEFSKLDQNQLVLFSNSPESLQEISTMKENRTLNSLSFSFGKRQLVSRFKEGESGGNSKITPFSEFRDPRIAIGRYFHILSDLNFTDLSISAWAINQLMAISPAEIFFDSTFPHGFVAAKILGYPDILVKQI